MEKQMFITVQHMLQNRETGNVEGYRNVAVVDASQSDTVEDALEYAYRYTNNIEGSWSIKEEYLPMRDGRMIANGDYNENVAVLYVRPDGMGQRSTMMGDRMIVDGETYKVAVMGFTKVEMETA